jgi:hypothetical protein
MSVEVLFNYNVIFVNLYNKRACPRKIQEQKRKIHNSDILGGYFLEAIF